jgi:hypothetical protein
MRIRRMCSIGATALLLIASEHAGAVHLNPHDQGQVLLFPYFTVNGGNQTLITLSNNTDRGKALKVRFREGYNAREVAGLHLYLAPGDAWTGSVYFDGIGATLVSRDRSCVVANGIGAPNSNGTYYLMFTNFNFIGPSADGYPSGRSRTNEGFLEVIEMGEVVDREHLSLTDISRVNPSYPPNDTVPRNCPRILEAWRNGGYWQLQAGADMNPPGGGLSGNAAIVDTLNGTMLSYNAYALDGFSSIVQHAAPVSQLPTLANAVTDAAANVAEAQVYIAGNLVTLRYPAATQGIDAVSAVIAAEVLHNDFVTSPALGAASEWVVTMPTKHFYTDIPASVDEPAIAPFLLSGQRSINVTWDLWNHESGPFGCSSFLTRYEPLCVFWLGPPIPEQGLPRVTSVLRFNQGEVSVAGTAIFGSMLSTSVPTAIDYNQFGGNEHTPDGHLWLNLYRQGGRTGWGTGGGSELNIMRPDLQGRRMLGLPVIGFWAVSYTNAAVTAGVLANYAGTVRHTITQSLAPLP